MQANQLQIGLWKDQLWVSIIYSAVLFSYSLKTRAVFESFSEVLCNMPLIYLRFNCYFYKQSFRIRSTPNQN